MLSLIAGLSAPAWADDSKTIAIKREAIQALRFSSDKNIALKRFACVKHETVRIKADIEARGTPFPDVAKYCPEVLKEAGRRRTLPQMYGLIEPLGQMEPWGKIFDAANQNQSHYIGPSGKQEPISCPLGFDAGYAGGYNQPDKASTFHEISNHRINKMIRTCFDPTIESKSLSFGGKAASSAYIGFIAGYIRGQQDAKHLSPSGK